MRSTILFSLNDIHEYDYVRFKYYVRFEYEQVFICVCCEARERRTHVKLLKIRRFNEDEGKIEKQF